MSARSRATAIHRWLGLLISVQLLISAAGGLFWATRDHKETKGLTRKRAVKPEPIPASEVVPLEAAILAAGGPAPLDRARLFRRGERIVWEVRLAERPPAYVDARSGETAGLLTSSEAIAIVQREYEPFPSFGHTPSARWITADPPPEWTGRPLPVWRVDLGDPFGTWIYVDPGTGETGNNWFTPSEDWWGWFFQMHTLDWDGGPLETNPLVAAFALGVIATALTGLTLWAFRVAARRRGQRLA